MEMSGYSNRMWEGVSINKKFNDILIASEEQALRDIKRLKMEKLESLTEDLRNDLEKAREAIRKDT